MEKLKELLGEELYNKVVEKLGKDNALFLHKPSDKVIIEDGSIIPKHRLDEVLQQKKNLEDQLKKNEDDLKELKKAVKGNEELTAVIEKLQADNKQIVADLAAKEMTIKKSFAIKEALMNAGVASEKARELLLHEFDLSKLTIDANGKISDIDNLIKTVKEDKTLVSLFGEHKATGTGHDANDDKPNDFYTPEQVKAMSQEEVTQNFDKVQKSMTNWK